MISQRQWDAFHAWGWDARQYADSTRGQYVRRAKAAERWLAARKITLNSANTADLQAWHTSLPATPSSRNMGRHALMAWFDFLIDRTSRATNPARLLPSFRYPESVPRALSREDAHAVVCQPYEPEWVFATSLLFHTLLRASEARRLEWAQIIDGQWVQVTVKGGRQRVLPMHPHTIDAAREWREECPHLRWVFPSPVKDAPLSESSFRERIKRIADQAGVAMTPHVARHTGATRMAERGVPATVIQELLGHASLATTQRYVRARPSDLAAAVGQLDLV